MHVVLTKCVQRQLLTNLDQQVVEVLAAAECRLVGAVCDLDVEGVHDPRCWRRVVDGLDGVCVESERGEIAAAVARRRHGDGEVVVVGRLRIDLRQRSLRRDGQYFPL